MALSDNIQSAANIISSMRDTAEFNSAKSAEQARIQREWQVQQNAKALAFNASEAAKNRNWQQMMSSTAHQREIKDLKAAGLNPVLSAMGGNGAAVTSGATASGVTSSGSKGDVDTSMNTALVNLLGSVYNRTTQLEAANINARTQEAIADKQAATAQIVANIGADASKYASDRNEWRSNYSFINGLLNDSTSSGTVLGKVVSTGKDVANKVSNSRFASDVRNWYSSSGLKKGVDSVLSYLGLKS